MPRLGIKSKLYLNSNTYDSPTWVELAVVSDLNVNAPWQEGESTTREARVQLMEQTFVAMEITGRARKEILNTAYLMMRAAFNTAATLDVLCLDGDTSTVGSDGFRFVGRVFNWGEDQSLGVVVFKEFSIKPCVAYDGDQNFRKPKVAIVSVADTVTYSDIG